MEIAGAAPSAVPMLQKILGRTIIERRRRAWPCATGACMLLICNGGAGPCPANRSAADFFIIL